LEVMNSRRDVLIDRKTQSWFDNGYIQCIKHSPSIKVMNGRWHSRIDSTCMLLVHSVSIEILVEPRSAFARA